MSFVRTGGPDRPVSKKNVSVLRNLELLVVKLTLLSKDDGFDHAQSSQFGRTHAFYSWMGESGLLVVTNVERA